MELESEAHLKTREQEGEIPVMVSNIRNAPIQLFLPILIPTRAGPSYNNLRGPYEINEIFGRVDDFSFVSILSAQFNGIWKKCDAENC